MDRFLFVFGPPFSYGQPLIVFMTDTRTPQLVYRALLLHPDRESYVLMHYDDPQMYLALTQWLQSQFAQVQPARMLCIFKDAADTFFHAQQHKQERVAVLRHLDQNPAMVDALAELVRAHQQSHHS